MSSTPSPSTSGEQPEDDALQLENAAEGEHARLSHGDVPSSSGYRSGRRGLRSPRSSRAQGCPPAPCRHRVRHVDDIDSRGHSVLTPEGHAVEPRLRAWSRQPLWHGEGASRRRLVRTRRYRRLRRRTRSVDLSRTAVVPIRLEEVAPEFGAAIRTTVVVIASARFEAHTIAGARLGTCRPGSDRVRRRPHHVVWAPMRRSVRSRAGSRVSNTTSWPAPEPRRARFSARRSSSDTGSPRGPVV